MNACLAIIGHEGARETIDLFLPRWRRLNIPIIGFVPEGDKWPSGHVSRWFALGENARTGQKVYQRFMQVCETLLRGTHDLFVIAEYDTANLSDSLPQYDPSAISTFVCCATDPWGKPLDICPVLSPWIMTRAMLWKLLEACRSYSETDHSSEDTEFINGLLDRWLGAVISAAKLPTYTMPDVLSYPWHESAKAEIVKNNVTWVHGWKTKEEFGDIWISN